MAKQHASPRMIEAARRLHAGDDVQIDADALESPADDGTWVQAWVWVPGEPDDA